MDRSVEKQIITEIINLLNKNNCTRYDAKNIMDHVQLSLERQSVNQCSEFDTDWL